jgi:two-component system sensor histidine kinase EvgS
MGFRWMPRAARGPHAMDEPALSQDRAILLVDNDPAHLREAGDALRRFGFEVAGVAGGHEAIALMGRRRFAAVLVGVHPTGVDGLGIVREIRRREANRHDRHQVLIALAAGSFAADRAQALAAGMDDCIDWPVRAEQVQAALARHRASD